MLCPVWVIKQTLEHASEMTALPLKSGHTQSRHQCLLSAISGHLPVRLLEVTGSPHSPRKVAFASLIGTTRGAALKPPFRGHLLK